MHRPAGYSQEKLVNSLSTRVLCQESHGRHCAKKATGESAMKRSSNVTVDKILDAAEMEFAAKGLFAGRVQGIAQIAGLSKQIVYRYFETKEELYQVLLERISDRHEDEMVRGDYDALAPTDAMELFIARLFDLQAKNGGHLIIDLALNESDRLRASKKRVVLVRSISACLDRIVARGKATGDFAPELETPQLLLMINMITNGAVSIGPLLADFLEIDLGAKQPVATMRALCVRFVLQAMRQSTIPGSSAALSG
jgi:AcrR family transcriptional regulator